MTITKSDSGSLEIEGRAKSAALDFGSAWDYAPAPETPDRFRLGASSLLNDVLMQIRTQKTGRYQNPEYFTRD